MSTTKACMYVHIAEDEDVPLQGINSYRTSLDLTPLLAKNEKAGCLAEKIVDQLGDHPCAATTKSSDWPAAGKLPESPLRV